MKKKVLAIILAGVMAISCLTGCGGKGGKAENSATNIEIAYWNGGLGRAWLDTLVEAFEEKHPEYTVTVNATASAAAIATAFGIPDGDTTDLYLYIQSEQTKYMEPLDDVLEATIEGESKSIGEKFQQSYLDSQVSSDGHYYMLTYGGGVIGPVYNEALFEKAGIEELPRTTKELAYVCDVLLENDIVPWCHFAPQGYWTWVNDVFFAQYCGYDYYKNNFYAAVDENGNSPSKELLTNKNDGRYATLKALEEIVTADYVLPASNTYDHATMQTKFMQGECAMMLNGSWFETEMSSQGSADGFKMMRMPVISSIVDNLTSISKESELTKLVAAIDSVTDGEKTIKDYKQGDDYVVDGMTVTAADWEYVDLARNSMANNFSSETAFIPSYSNCKEGAKEFLKFLYSDEGYQKYLDVLGTTMPLNMSDKEADYSSLSSFGKSVFDISNTTKQFITMEAVNRHVVYKETNARSFGTVNVIPAFTTRNTGERKTAEEFWNAYVADIEQNWDEWLQNIN